MRRFLKIFPHLLATRFSGPGHTFLAPALAALCVALAPTLRAQTASVRWDPPGGALAAGQVVTLNLVFENCEPSAGVTPPTTTGLEFGQPSRGENSSISFVNGRVTGSRRIILGYPVRAAAGQTAVTIPAFEVETDQGRVRVAAANFTVGAATVPGGNGAGVPLDSVMRSHFTVPESVWVGEVFPFIYTLEVLERYPASLGSDPEWKPAPLVAEDDLSKLKPKVTRTVRNGDTYSAVAYGTRVYVGAPNAVALPPVSQVVNLQSGTQALGFFSQPTLQQFSVVTAPATLTVKPLPAPAPAGFTGAVGDFKLTAKVVPAAAAVGEPVTWTLTLEGTGNWPDLAGLPPRSVSRDFRTVSPQAKRATAEGKLFDATLAEDIVLIPTKPGTYTLGPVTMACFDPKTGQYQNLTTEKFTVTITDSAPAAAGNNSAPPAGSGTGSATLPPPPGPPPALSAPPSPAGLPRDPLPSAPPATPPLSSRTLALLLLSPAPVLLALWASLALRRARQTDPLRARREARARLATTIAEITAALTSNSGSRLAALDSRLLLSWRRDTALFFGVPHAEPTANDLAPAPSPQLPPPLPGELAAPASPGAIVSGPSTIPLADWQSLWHDADRALFGARAALPSDWPARAESALAATPLPPFRPLRLFLPRNLFPVLALLALLSPFSAFAADTTDAYRAADFPAAEKAWRSALATAPADWSAHHNLSLALAQQGRWPEAAGHALAAFAQQPHDPAVRWQAALALKNAGWIPDAARPFFAAETPGPRAALALRAAPATWQCAALLAALLAAAALALLLWRAYATAPLASPQARVLHHISARWPAPLAWAVLISALLLGGAAASSLRLYGPLADARAVLVWQGGVLRSIPTEADAEQKTVPLSPGLVALDEGQPFLSWRHLSFPNGQTGWVRQETLVRLW
jgi:tetratricopeptide (TPR) repeat protein